MVGGRRVITGGAKTPRVSCSTTVVNRKLPVPRSHARCWLYAAVLLAAVVRAGGADYRVAITGRLSGVMEQRSELAAVHPVFAQPIRSRLIVAWTLRAAPQEPVTGAQVDILVPLAASRLGRAPLSHSYAKAILSLAARYRRLVGPEDGRITQAILVQAPAFDFREIKQLAGWDRPAATANLERATVGAKHYTATDLVDHSLMPLMPAGEKDGTPLSLPDLGALVPRSLVEAFLPEVLASAPAVLVPTGDGAAFTYAADIAPEDFAEVSRFRDVHWIEPLRLEIHVNRSAESFAPSRR